MKKILAMCAALTLLTGLLAVPASAHHGGGHHAKRAVSSYAVCTVENCGQTGRHAHDGVTYCGYDHETGTCTGSSCAAAQSTCGGGHHGGHC